MSPRQQCARRFCFGAEAVVGLLGLMLVVSVSAQPTASAPAQAPPQSANTVSMPNDRFAPVDITVSAGTTVRWVNTGAVTHSVTPDTSAGPNSDRRFPFGLQPGETYSWRVPADSPPGTVWYYHCRYHGQSGQGMGLGAGMAGSVTVR